MIIHLDRVLNDMQVSWYLTERLKNVPDWFVGVIFDNQKEIYVATPRTIDVFGELGAEAWVVHVQNEYCGLRLFDEDSLREINEKVEKAYQNKQTIEKQGIRAYLGLDLPEKQ